MDLSNLIETIVYYFPIGEMTSLSHRDDFPMMSAIMCIVTHLTWPMVNHDINCWVVMIHHDTRLYKLSTLRKYWVYAKINKKLLSMGEILMWSYIPYKLGYSWWRLVATGILNRDNIISYEIKTTCLLGDPKDMWSRWLWP